MKVRNFFYFLLRAALTGVFSGCVIALFKKSIAAVQNLRAALSSPPLFACLAAFILIIVALQAFFIHRHPALSGGGAAQVKEDIAGKKRLDLISSLFLKFTFSCCNIAMGLSMGKEGPAVQMCGCASLIVKGENENERKILCTAGAAAGLAAAFNSPFTAVVFAFEELYREKKPLSFILDLIAIASASFISYFVCTLLCGSQAAFPFHTSSGLPFKSFLLLPILALSCAVFALLFRASLKFFALAFKKFHSSALTKTALPYAILIPVLIFIPIISGGGEAIFSLLSKEEIGEITLYSLLLFLITKLLFTAFCVASGAPGGIYVPLLACGALTGALSAKLFIKAGVITGATFPQMIIFSMAATLGTALNLPLSATVLLLELSRPAKTDIAALFVTVYTAFFIRFGIEKLRALFKAKFSERNAP